MYKFLPEPDNWLEVIPFQVVCAYFDRRVEITKLLRWHLRHGGGFGAPLSAYEILREYGVYMPRKGKSNGTTADNGRNDDSGTRSNAKWQWGNCRLSNEDIANLDRDTSTLEYLATCLVTLGNDGFGFSCKPVDKGESRNCTIYRPDFPAVGVIVGVSAFGGNIRDAILTCLYKLDTYGGGDFSGFDLEVQDSSARPRFR